MKRPITPVYTFTPGSSTLNLSGISGFSIANLFAVIDLKTGVLIYAPLAGYGYSALSGTTLTLQASMTGLSAADPLLILYDDGGKPAEDSSVQAVTTAIGALTASLSNEHGDLATLHTDVGTTLHADLAAILAKQPATPALDGTDASGVTMPSGGAGLRGWLSGLYGGLASLVSTTLGKAFRVVLVDPTTGNGSLVQAFHNSDNQAIGGTSYGLFTGGVDQLLNSAGNLDRKRAVAGDGMAATGLSADVPMLWNGSNYDRAAGDKTNGAWVNIKAAVGLTIGKTAAAGDASVATGGTAQTLFSGATSANGWKVANPDPAEDLWVSDSTTAAPNGQGSYRVPAGGIVTTEPGEKPCGPLSVYGATTGHVITARAW